jgi:anaerobic magnesium-protoporphyrin IX monomethyl ester cyclase
MGVSMRIILADLRGREGVVAKDTVAGGYGSRLRPFSMTTRVVAAVKRRFHDVPSVQMAYLAAICAQWGHDIVWSSGADEDGDVALVLSSLVDYRHEVAWADGLRRRGVRTGFVGLTATKLPELFEHAADFLILGEPEAAVQRLARGDRLSGMHVSEPVVDLDSLPFPRWDLVRASRRGGFLMPLVYRPWGGAFPVLASRGCPEFCTYCPHRILAGYRARSVASIADELQALCDVQRRPYLIFRDPLFTQQRDRALALADEIRARHLDVRFECETRLDRLDPELLDDLHAAGLRAISFGVESVSADTLRKVGRRPTPEMHQRAIIDHCRRRGIVTAGFYVLGFLQDDWSSVAATIEYAIALGTTVAQFKLLTPYPGTPLWKQMAPLVYETDWQNFDGFTPTFRHPRLSANELRFLLAAAYTHFYQRPSWALDYCRVSKPAIRAVARHIDARVARRQAQRELACMSRTVTC